MRKTALLIAASMALATAGCVESMDAGYPSGAYAGDGYESSGYYASYPSGYYTQPTAFYALTQVVTDVRYVPVAVAERGPARDHANTQPAPQPPSHTPNNTAAGPAPARTALAQPSAQQPAQHQASSSRSSSHDDHHGNQRQSDGNNR